MANFGWSYPAGCSGPPEDPEPSVLQEEVLDLLEVAGIDATTRDKIMALLEAAETAEAEQDLAEYAREVHEDKLTTSQLYGED